MEGSTKKRIVVGIDGSEQSRAALRWALSEAKRRGSSLDVIHAWHVPFVKEAYTGSASNEEAALGAMLEAELGSVSEEAEGVDVRTRLVYGMPAPTLVDMAQDAELLVVGSRGRGGFAGLLLGSVSQECAAHALCPVAIIREPAEQAA
jgi:nucleotide-binding universal stress UspA family protein